jgi:hypothetical protein
MLYFHNPGEIDIRGATIAGLSAKQGDSPIGFFGTGLKYAIASVLRWHGQITIWSGEEEYKFYASPLDFRGKEFQQIMMSGQPLGFTTEYGKTWEPWQIFRELYANALDEGGQVGTAPPGPRAGFTCIEVDCDRLAEAYATRDLIILPRTTAYFHSDETVSIGRETASGIYYRGVRVHPENTLFTYNFQKSISLTEDRTMKWAWELPNIIGAVLQRLTDEDLVHRTVSAPKGFLESKAEFSGSSPLSPAFLNVAERLYLQDAVKWKKFEEVLRSHRPACLAPKLIELSPFRQKMLDRACDLCARMGLHPADHEIFVADLGNSVLGLYEPASGRIYLSPKCFDMGTKQVVSALYEELIHAETGKVDCCYDMQTFLFDKIISLYEEFVFQEPI